MAGLDGAVSLKEQWPEWTSKLLKLAKVEATTRPAIRKLLQQIVQDPSPSLDNKDGKNSS